MFTPRGRSAIPELGSCSVIATFGEDGLYALRFELRNRGREPVTLLIYEPFTAFSVSAPADGEPVTVHRPRLDIAINPTTLSIPPGGVATIHSPIRLRIAEGAELGTDRFVWTIAHRPEALSLHVRLDLPAPFGGPWPLLFD